MRQNGGQNPRQNLRQNLPQNLWQNLWQSHDSSRRRNPENRWKSWKMIKIEIGSLGSHLARCVVLYWKMDDFGGVEVARLAGGWLAGRASLKMLEPKDPIRPVGGQKTQAFWLAPQKNLLSVMLVSHFQSICGVPRCYHVMM